MSGAGQSREDRMGRALEGRNRGEGPPPRRASEMRMKPVRMTVDMPPPLHRNLKSFSAWAAGQMDVADVPAAKVVRILVNLLTANPEEVELARPLVTAVMAELRKEQDEQ